MWGDCQDFVVQLSDKKNLRDLELGFKLKTRLMSGFRFDFNGMLSCFPALKLWLLQQQPLNISYKTEVLQQSTFTRKCFSQGSGILLVTFMLCGLPLFLTLCYLFPFLHFNNSPIAPFWKLQGSLVPRFCFLYTQFFLPMFYLVVFSFFSSLLTASVRFQSCANIYFFPTAFYFLNWHVIFFLVL